MKILVDSDSSLNDAHTEYERFTHDDDLREIYEMRVEGRRYIETVKKI